LLSGAAGSGSTWRAGPFLRGARAASCRCARNGQQAYARKAGQSRATFRFRYAKGVAVVVVVDDDVVVSGGAVVGGGWAGGVPSGAGWLNGTGALGPFFTYTGVPFGTFEGNHSASYIGMRTQPCDAGYAGTDGAPWMAMPPLK